MSKIDVVMVMLGIFSYFSIMYRIKDNSIRLLQQQEMIKKKRAYEDRLREMKQQEIDAKASANRKQKMKHNFDNMASAAEMMTTLSDQEVMKSSRITNGKY